MNPAGFAEAVPPLVRAVACGALLHPPKSSSALTFGLVIFGVAPNPPEFASQPPEDAAGGRAAAVVAGFESLHTSLEDPHASKLSLRLANDEV